MHETVGASAIGLTPLVVNHAPRAPNDVETPEPLKFSRTLGNSEHGVGTVEPLSSEMGQISGQERQSHNDAKNDCK